MPTLNAKTRETMTHEAMVDNILRRYDAATPAQRRDGAAWYGRAEAIVRATAATSGLPREAVAGIIAALSPRMRWGANVRAAIAVAHGQPVRCLSRSREAAEAIRAAGDWRGILRGPKTRAFAAAVESGGISIAYGAVCDAWAVRAATDGAFDSVAKCRYDDVAAAYMSAARMRGVNVHALQAIVWTVERGSAA